MSTARVLRHQLIGDFDREIMPDASLYVNVRQFFALVLGVLVEFLLSLARSARSVSDYELTETYPPAAIDIAPATSPATPAKRTSLGFAAAAATPTIKLAIDTMPSFAPTAAARSHPMRLAL